MSIIEKIEFSLLHTLFNYVVPFLDKKIKTIKKDEDKQSNNLENIINNLKPKINSDDVKALELLLLRNIDENAKISKSSAEDSSNFSFSLNLARQKNNIAQSEIRTASENNEKSNNYKIFIKYEENQNGDKLSISVKKSGFISVPVGYSSKKFACK